MCMRPTPIFPIVVYHKTIAKITTIITMNMQQQRDFPRDSYSSEMHIVAVAAGNIESDNGLMSIWRNQYKLVNCK